MCLAYLLWEFGEAAGLGNLGECGTPIYYYFGEIVFTTKI